MLDNCPLCGSPLKWWDRSEATRCYGCKAWIEPEEEKPNLFVVPDEPPEYPAGKIR